jgi:hypothetical protein
MNKGEKIPDNQIAFFQTPDGKVNIEVLYKDWIEKLNASSGHNATTSIFWEWSGMAGHRRGEDVWQSQLSVKFYPVYSSNRRDLLLHKAALHLPLPVF